MTESSTRSAAHTTIKQKGFVGAVLLAFSLSGGLAFGADDPGGATSQSVQIPATGMKSGRLTAKEEGSAAINGQSYAFHSKIVFADDEREPIQWSNFKKGDEVQFHLKQERIDFLILVRPK